MIAFCRRRRQAIITVGGAGGQRDPTRVRISDLRRTEQDPLLARTRKLLRQDYGFPVNPQAPLQVPQRGPTSRSWHRPTAAIRWRRAH